MFLRTCSYSPPRQGAAGGRNFPGEPALPLGAGVYAQAAPVLQGTSGSEHLLTFEEKYSFSHSPQA